MARSFDFSNLFEAIDEPDIGDAKLADVILKSVTQWNDEHRFELLGIHSNEETRRTVENTLQSPDYEDVALRPTSDPLEKWDILDSAQHQVYAIAV